MAAEANELMGFAFRPGKDYKPLELMEQARRQKALSAQAQAEEQQKKVNESLKFSKDIVYQPEHINFEANKYLTRKAEEFNSLTAETLRKNNYILSPEDQIELQRKQQDILGEQRILKASQDEVVRLNNGFLNNPDFRELFNQKNAAVTLRESYNKIFLEDGKTLNPDWDPSSMQSEIMKPENLNESKVRERFANTIEMQLNEMISKQGNGDIREVSTKTNFAKLNSSGTDWERDANGNIKLNITPELVKSMRADEFTSVLLDDQLAKLQVENPAATYTEAAEKLLQQSVKTERKEALRTPSSGGRGSGRPPREATWNESGQIDYKGRDELQEDGVIGIEAMTIEANGLQKGISFVIQGEGKDAETVKGDVNGFRINKFGQPEIVLTQQIASGVPPRVTYIPFDDKNYKSLRSSLKDNVDVEFLDRVKASVPEAIKNQKKIYYDERKSKSFQAEVWQSLQNSNSGADITKKVTDIFNQYGFDYEKIEGYSPFIVGFSNSVNIDGVDYYVEDIPKLVDELYNKKPSVFSTTSPTSRESSEAQRNEGSTQSTGGIY